MGALRRRRNLFQVSLWEDQICNRTGGGGVRLGLHAGHQSAPHMHVLVRRCSNARPPQSGGGKQEHWVGVDTPQNPTETDPRGLGGDPDRKIGKK